MRVIRTFDKIKLKVVNYEYVRTDIMKTYNLRDTRTIYYYQSIFRIQYPHFKHIDM